jgi:hypothetical protein
MILVVFIVKVLQLNFYAIQIMPVDAHHRQ